MIPSNYSEAKSELEKRRERKESRAAKRASMGSKSLKNDQEGPLRDYKGYVIGGPGPWKKGRKKRKKALSRSKLEKEAWDAFSLYIRERDKDLGCFSCGVIHGAVMEAGHLISRRRRATKFDEVNVNAQCRPCNWKDKFLPGYHDHCVSKFIERYSLATFNSLLEHSREIVQHGKADMVAIRDTYREKLLTLKASRAQQAEDDRMQR